MTEEEYYDKAKKLVKAKQAFRINVWIFATTMPVIIIVNLMTSPEYLWFLWALIGWLPTLVIFYLIAYVQPKYSYKESDEVEKEMEKMRLRDPKYTSRNARKDDLDEHLDLRELKKDYNEQDFV